MMVMVQLKIKHKRNVKWATRNVRWAARNVRWATGKYNVSDRYLLKQPLRNEISTEYAITSRYLVNTSSALK